MLWHRKIRKYSFQISTAVILLMLASASFAKSYCYNALMIQASDLYLTKEEIAKLKPDEIPQAAGLKKSFFELWDRSKAFAKKNADRVRLVEQIRVKFEDMDGRPRTYEGNRNVLVVSLKGLGREKDKFVESVLKMLGPNVVSFPLGEGAGHLYTQFRGRVYDSMGTITNGPYQATGSERLETLIVLSEAESKNLATYIQNAETNPERTIGPFNYAGGTKTKGKLDDNRCLRNGHNCTSWMALAPIGERRQTIMQLIGIPANTEWGTNPGYLSAGLMTRSNEDRTPFVVIWTNDKIDNFATRMVSSDGTLIWDFSPH